MPQHTAFISVAPDISLHTHISVPEQTSQLPTLLLLHFWGGSNQTYFPFIDQVKAEYTIIAPSLRGWGQSCRPTAENAYRISDHANDVVNLILDLHVSESSLFTNGTVLVGHSMGGKIAQLLLTRTEIPLKGLILIAPAPAGSFHLPATMRDQQISAYDSEESASFVIENVLLGHPGNVSTTLKTEMAKTAHGGSEAAKRAWPKYGMGEDYEDVVLKAIDARGGGLQIEVLVGELDRVETPSSVRNNVVEPLRKAGADVVVEEINGVGHLIPIEAPKAIGEAVRRII